MRVAFSHRKLFDYALIAVSTAMGLYHMWMIVFGSPEAVLFRGMHLLFAMVLIFLFSHSADSSGCSMDKIPPNPQHSSAWGSSTTCAPRTSWPPPT